MNTILEASIGASCLNFRAPGLVVIQGKNMPVTEPGPSEWRELKPSDEEWFRERTSLAKNVDPLSYLTGCMHGHYVQNESNEWTKVEGLGPQEKTYIAVNRLIGKGFFGDRSKVKSVNREDLSNKLALKEENAVDLEDPNHRMALAVGLRCFGEEEELTDMSFGERFIAAHICDAFEREMDDRGFDLTLPGNPSNWGRAKLGAMRLGLGKVSKAVLKTTGIVAVGELARIFSRKDPMCKEEFQRIFGDSYEPSDIPEILNSGIQLDVNLKTDLLRQLTTHLMAQNHGSSAIEQASCSDIAIVLKTAEELNHNLPEAVTASLVESYERKIPNEKSLEGEQAEVEKLDKDTKKLERKEEMKKALKDAAEELGKAVHTWVQWGKDIRRRDARFHQTASEFTTLLKDLEIRDLTEFQNKPLGKVQKLMQLKIIQARAKGIHIIKETTKAYQEDVKRTKEAIARCHGENARLQLHAQGLKQLTRDIIKHEIETERHYRKLDKGLRMVYAIASGIKVAAMVAANVGTGGAAAAAKLAAQRSSQAESGLQIGHQYIGSLWDSQYSWFRHQLEGIGSASQNLYSAHGRLQGWLHTLLTRQEQQAMFLLMNPDYFAPQAYLRNLREKIHDARDGLNHLDQKITQAQRENKGHDVHLQQLVPCLRKRDEAVFFTSRHDRKAKNRRLKRLQRTKTKIANIVAERTQNQTSIEEWLFRQRQEKEELETYCARLAQYEEIASLPDHHKAGAEKMSLEERLRSTECYQNKLRKKISDLSASLHNLEHDASRCSNENDCQVFSIATESTREDLQECQSSLRDEQLLEARTRRSLGLQKLRDASPASHDSLLPAMRLDCHRRIIISQSFVPLEEHALEGKCKEENDALKKVESQLTVVDALPDKDKDPNRQPLHEEVRKLQNLQDAYTDAKDDRREQERRLEEIRGNIRDDIGLRDGHLWEMVTHLPHEKRVACSQHYVNALDQEYQSRQHNEKTLAQTKDKLIEELKTEGLNEADRAIKQENLKTVENLLKHCSQGLMQEGRHLRDTKLRHSYLSYDASVEKWNGADISRKETLLHTMQKEAYHRKNLTASSLEDAQRDLPQLKLQSENAEARRKAAELSLKEVQENPNESEREAAQYEFDQADKEYLFARNNLLDVKEQIERCEQHLEQNEQTRQSFYISAHASRMQLALRYWRGESEDPHERALGEQMGGVLRTFDQQNIIRELANFSDQLEWYAETFKGKPLGRDEREFTRRISLGMNAVASIVAFGAICWSINTTAHKKHAIQFEQAAEEGDGQIPPMSWMEWGIMLGYAFYGVSWVDKIFMAQMALKGFAHLKSAFDVLCKEKKLVQPTVFERIIDLENSLKMHLDNNLEYLKSHIDASAEDIKNEIQKLQMEMRNLAEESDRRLAVVQVRVEKQALTTQEDRLAKEIREFSSSCAKALAWAKKPHAEDTSWVEEFLQKVDTQIKALSDVDLTGKNKAKTVPWRMMVKQPSMYVGLMGSPKENSPLPSLSMFNAVGEILLKVAKTARELGSESFLSVHGKAIHSRIQTLLRYSERIESLRTNLYKSLKRAASSLKVVKNEILSRRLRLAERKEKEVEKSIIQQTMQDSEATLQSLVEEANPALRRFAVHRLVTEKCLPDIESHAKSLLEIYKSSGNIQRGMTIVGSGIIGGSWGPPGIVAGLVISTTAVFLTPKDRADIPSLVNRAKNWTMRARSDRLSEGQEEQTAIIADPWGKCARKLIHLEFLIATAKGHQPTLFQSTLGWKETQGGALSQKTIKIPLIPQKPLWAAKVRFYLNSTNQEQAQFLASSALQPCDIEHVKSPWHGLEGTPYFDGGHYCAAIKKLYTGYKEALRNPLNENPLRSIISKSKLIAPKTKGMIPLYLPKPMIKVLDKKIKPHRMLFHLLGMGSFIQYYEYPEVEAGQERVLSILCRLRSPDGKMETNFCRIRKIFGLDALTQKAIDGYPVEGQTFTSEAAGSRQLLFMLYGSFFGLNAPGKDSYQLQGGSAVAPVDVDFRGGYRELEAHLRKGTTFKGKDYTGQVPDEWNTPLEIEYCEEAYPVITEALKNLNTLHSYVTKTKEFRTFEKNYYKAMMEIALFYSNRRVVHGNNFKEKEVQEKVDLSTWERLFNQSGLPKLATPLEVFKLVVNKQVPDTHGIVIQAKDYPPTVDFNNFERIVGHLSILSKTLPTQHRRRASIT